MIVWEIVLHGVSCASAACAACHTVLTSRVNQPMLASALSSQAHFVCEAVAVQLQLLQQQCCVGAQVPSSKQQSLVANRDAWQ